MIRVFLYQVYYFYGYPLGTWEAFEDTKHRLTGRWRLIDGDVSIEVECGRWERRFFQNKWLTDTRWYHSHQVKFIHEFNCAT